MSNSTSETSSPETAASETYSSELYSTDHAKALGENPSSGEEGGVSQSYEQQRTPVFSPESFQISSHDRLRLLTGLRKRNLRESSPFVNLFQEHEIIYSRVEQLQKKTIQLQIDNERLKQVKDASLNAQGEHGDSPLRSQISELEKRLYEAQRDLTTALRGKDENSQRILELNDKIRSKDDEIMLKEQKIRQLETELESNRGTVSQMGAKIENLEELKQAQADEYSALALSCTQFEDRLLKSEDENRHLLQQLVKVKQQLADHLNTQNEEVIEIRQLETELESNRGTVSQMGAKIENLEELKQAQADEYSALALSCTQFEDRLLKSEDENRHLLQQLVKVKQQLADHLNTQNEEVIEKQNNDRRTTINEAADRLKKKVEVANSMEQPCPPYVILSSDIPNTARNSFEAHSDEVTCVRFLNNHNFITAGVDRFVKLWDSSAGHQVKAVSTLSSCNGAVTCVDVDQQETCIVASSYDNSSRIWSLRDHRLKHSLTGHTGKVMAARFISDDSHKVATGSYDRTIKVWDLKQRLCSRVLHCHSSCTDLVTIEGNELCSGHLDKRIRFWDLRNQTSDMSVNEISLSGKVTSVHASRNRNDVLTCTKDGQLKVIDFRNSKMVKATLVSDALKIGADYSRASLSPDGRFAMAGSSDGTIVIFDVNSEKVDRTLRQHQSVILATAWSNDGTKLLSCDKGKKVILWCDR